jgi:hypothetical protein
VLQALVTKIQTGILDPIIGLLFVLATVIFLWGVIQYVIGSQGNETKLEKGKQVMIWGIIGMTVMASAWGIVAVICQFFGTCR